MSKLKNPNLVFAEIPITKKYRPQTDETSFILRPSGISGVGVFIAHSIKKETHLNVFPSPNELTRFIKKQALNTPLLQAFATIYGVASQGGFYMPPNFSHMEIGWYMNHSENPNAYHDENYNYYASRDIKGGEEITIDYSKL